MGTEGLPPGAVPRAAAHRRGLRATGPGLEGAGAAAAEGVLQPVVDAGGLPRRCQPALRHWGRLLRRKSGVRKWHREAGADLLTLDAPRPAVYLALPGSSACGFFVQARV